MFSFFVFIKYIFTCNASQQQYSIFAFQEKEHDLTLLLQCFLEFYFMIRLFLDDNDNEDEWRFMEFLFRLYLVHTNFEGNEEKIF